MHELPLVDGCRLVFLVALHSSIVLYVIQCVVVYLCSNVCQALPKDKLTEVSVPHPIVSFKRYCIFSAGASTKQTVFVSACKEGIWAQHERHSVSHGVVPCTAEHPSIAHKLYLT